MAKDEHPTIGGTSSGTYETPVTGPSRGVTVFYSFRGGVGRTLALSGTAKRLAALPRRVLMVDADIEAPGLTFAHIRQRDRHDIEGFSDVCVEVCELLKRHLATSEPMKPDWLSELASLIRPRIVHLEPPKNQHPEMEARMREDFPDIMKGIGAPALDLLPVGEVLANYAGALAPLPLIESFSRELKREDKPFLDSLGLKPKSDGAFGTLGEVFGAVLKATLLHVTAPDHEPYHYVLVDSRTGLADVAGFCVKWLADRIVLLSGLNVQNADGTAFVLKEHLANRAADITLVLSPLPETEVALRQERKKRVLDQFHRAAPKLNISDPIELCYHPRASLIEEDFLDEALSHTMLARGYRALQRRLAAVYADTPSDDIARAFRLISEKQHNAALQSLAVALLDNPGQTEPVLRVFLEPMLLGQGQLSDASAGIAGLYATISVQHLGQVVQALGKAATSAVLLKNPQAPALLKRLDAAFRKLVADDPQPLRVWVASAHADASIAIAMWDIADTETARLRFE